MAGEKRAMLQDHVPQARIYKTWNIPGYDTRDYTMLDSSRRTCWRSGKNSRLYKRLVYTDQIATASAPASVRSRSARSSRSPSP